MNSSASIIEEVEAQHSRKPGFKEWVEAILKFMAVLVAMATVAVVIITTVTLFRVKDLTEETLKTSQQTANISQRLEDCTTPTGQCYKDGNARTNTAVVNLTEVTKAAAVCAKKPEFTTYEQIDKCIRETIAAK